MNIKIIVILANLLCVAVYASPMASPTDVQTFEKTGSCVTNCDLSGVINLSTSVKGPINVSNAILARTTFFGSDDHQNSNFQNVFGYHMDYSYSDLSSSNFSNSNLKNSSFNGDTLTRANFTGANITGASFNQANLYQAILTPTQLASASDLCNAILPDGSIGSCQNKSVKNIKK